MPPRLPSRKADDLAALQAHLGYTFTDPALLRLALTHRSHTYETTNGPGSSGPHVSDSHQRNAPGTDNEQLEFLGDAVLGLLVSEALLREFPACTEGELTRLRSALVSRARMAEFGRALSLAGHILLGRGVAQNIVPPAGETTSRVQLALLANAAEAVLAAVYLDASRSGAEPLPILRSLVARHLLDPDLPLLRAALAQAPHRGVLRDSKTLLQELAQAQNAGKLRYLDLDQSGPPHDRHFTVQVELTPPVPPTPLVDPEQAGQGSAVASAAPVPRLLATGEGRSKKEAQQAAAALALAHWPAPAPGSEQTSAGSVPPPADALA